MVTFCGMQSGSLWALTTGDHLLEPAEADHLEEARIDLRELLDHHRHQVHLVGRQESLRPLSAATVARAAAEVT